jgi:TonB family protein
MNSNNRRARTTARKTILAIAAALLLSASLPVFAQEPACKSKSGEVKVNYPELARRMKIYGVVRLQLQLSAAGAVRESKILGGNPVLAGAAQQAVRNAHFDGAESCVITFEFKE